MKCFRCLPLAIPLYINTPEVHSLNIDRWNSDELFIYPRQNTTIIIAKSSGF